MDARYLGSSLISRNDSEADRHPASATDREHAYDMRHAPADSRVLKVTAAVAVAWAGLMTIDFLLR
jgi:hypothetical protein